MFSKEKRTENGTERGMKTMSGIESCPYETLSRWGERWVRRISGMRSDKYDKIYKMRNGFIMKHVLAGGGG